jgi:hypothetical protein
MRTRALIGAAMMALFATSASTQEPKPKTGDDHPMLTIEGCLDGNWLHVKKVDPVGSSTERYRLRGSKSLLKEMASEYRGHLLEVTGVVTDPTTNTTHRGKTIEVGKKTRITTSAKEMPAVPDAATEPWIEVASYRDLKTTCDK